MFKFSWIKSFWARKSYYGTGTTNNPIAKRRRTKSRYDRNIIIKKFK